MTRYFGAEPGPARRVTVSVRLSDGRIVEMDAIKAARLVRKKRAVYYKVATRQRETAMHRAPEQR